MKTPLTLTGGYTGNSSAVVKKVAMPRFQCILVKYLYDVPTQSFR